MNENQKTPVIEMRRVEIGAMHEPGFTVVEEVNWTVAPGEFWVIAGQQHSGKSDLLMTTAGLMSPLNGHYQLFGNETELLDEQQLTKKLRVGFVFESGQLFNRLTIAENIALPLRYHRDLPAGAGEQRMQALMELMELMPLADVTPSNVSANWLKRAALARALILQPELLLLDNPLGGLGARHLVWWLHFLDQLWRGHEWLEGRPMTMIATTDDLSRVAGWRNNARRFGLLKEKKFSLLGSWQDVTTANDSVVKELLAVPLETTI